MLTSSSGYRTMPQRHPWMGRLIAIIAIMAVMNWSVWSADLFADEPPPLQPLRVAVVESSPNCGWPRKILPGRRSRQRWLCSQTSLTHGKVIPATPHRLRLPRGCKQPGPPAVLYRHVGLTVNTECLDPNNIYDASNSCIHFIHGVLLDGDPATCCAAPVIFAAIGRRLGYPIKLVKTRAHLFCRWVGPDGERFNIEATNQGYYRTPDEHYHTWPLPIYPKALQSGVFLTDLTPRQELALSLHLRGICLMWNLRPAEAVEPLYHACQLDPLDCFFHNEWIIASMFSHAEQDAVNRYGSPDPDPRLWRIPEWCRESNAQLYQAACNRLKGILTEQINKNHESTVGGTMS